MNKFEVGGALEVGSGQKNVQWCRIHAAVIATERNLSQVGHFARACFVQDLAGFGVAGGIDFPGLRFRQEAQHASRQAGAEPEALQGGDDAVPAERRAEPGDAAIRIGTGIRLRDHHVQVSQAPVQPGIELSLRCVNDRGLRVRLLERGQG